MDRTAPELGNALLSRIAQLRGKFAANRRRWAIPLTAAALLLFLGGSWYSLKMLRDSGISLDPAAFVAVLAIAPISVLYAGIGLWLMARAVQTSVPIGRATVIASYAMLAEALPVPGGAIVRAGALVSSGASMGRSVILTLVLAVMWISLAAVGSGMALGTHDSPIALPMLLGGIAGVGMSGAMLLKEAGAATTALTMLHRVSGMALIAVRLKLTFLAIGLTVPLADTLPFALANIAGSAASIAPAGLGISETLAALVAGSVSVPAAAAFLVVGLDRLICLGACALASTAVFRNGTVVEVSAGK